MNGLKVALVALLVVVLIESAFIVAPYLTPKETVTYSPGPSRSYGYPYQTFDQTISNDTNVSLQPSYNGSWMISIATTLSATAGSEGSEAQIALAPTFKFENLSIPTIIVQERADGLLRIEYFAQDWNKTFGLVLYNSSSPSWLGGENVSLRFVQFGPPSQVNPQIAPRPDGNLTITVGTTVVVSDYPIAWANLTHMFLYGVAGSAFVSGSMNVTIRALTRSG